METGFSLKEALQIWGIDHHSPYRAMLLDFIEDHARRLAAGQARPDTLAAWLQRQAGLKPRLLHSLGLARFPERSLLRARITGEIERPDYVLQKLVYESRPGFPVSAHLYLPRQADFPAPAVLYAPGHWMENGKLEADIQLCCANLARLGFVALVYDPIGQGERRGDWLDHGHLEPLLIGLSQEGLMVWESMRAIDFLCSRPEVDDRRIGMTGASGGGLNTFYTSAVDERIRVSVPVCYITTFLDMMRAERDRNWEDGVDLCNQVPGVMAYAEMSDICGLFAGNPLCIIAGIRDWMFPIDGVRQVYREVERIYELVGAPEKARLVEVDAGHGYDREMRQAAYGWLARWLLNQGDGSPIPEQEIELLPAPYPPALTYMAPPEPQDLSLLRQRASYPAWTPGWCFPEGASPPPGPAITRLARQVARSLPPHQNPPVDVQDWDRQRAGLLDRVRAVLGPFPQSGLVRDRTFNQVLHRQLFAERVVFESEPGIEIPAMFLAPADWQNYLPVVIYVDEWGKGAGLANGIIEALLKARLAVLAIDVRGVGETAASDFEAATNALMTDRPLFGQRVWDVLRAVDYLWRRIYITIQIDKGRIGCAGRGTGGLLALYAAALDERLAAAVVWQAPVSYKSLLVERPGFPASAYLFDVLNQFDLPQVMAAVAPRPLLVVDPVDGLREALSGEEAAGTCAWPQHVYQLSGQDGGRLHLLAQADRPATVEAIAGWLRQQLGS